MDMGTAVYHVNRVFRKPSLSASIREDVWQAAEECRLENFRPESSNHRPVVSARLVHDGSWLYGLFSVQDRYVRSVQTAYGSAVCTDSCVEFFVKPKADRGYFNFEFNAGGTLHCSYITDPRRSPAGGFRAFTLLPEEQGRMVKVRSTLPRVVEPEIQSPIEWMLEFHIPIKLLEKHAGPVGDPGGQAWRANFYKCGDMTSHPHWASWSNVDELNFHLPRCFGVLIFM